MIQVWAAAETNGTVSWPASAGLLICTSIRFVDAAPSLLCLIEYPIARRDQPYAAAATARDGEMRSCAPARGPPRQQTNRTRFQKLARSRFTCLYICAAGGGFRWGDGQMSQAGRVGPVGGRQCGGGGSVGVLRGAAGGTALQVEIKASGGTSGNGGWKLKAEVAQGRRGVDHRICSLHR